MFEVWIGDDGADELATHLAAALSDLNRSGTAIFFIHGNRDFLLGRGYCQSAGMELLDEPVILDSPGARTALIHGDTLCSDDQDYQRFRRRVRNPTWQARMLKRPLWWRRLLARMARWASKRRSGVKAADIMDVNTEAVKACFSELEVQRLIHGHTHRPAVHDLRIDGKACQRIVLGDWHGTSGSVLRLRGAEASLMILRRDSAGKLKLAPI